MSNEAKVRIGGDSSGATRATTQTRDGLKGIGDQAKQTGDQAKQAAEQAAKAEKLFEAEVQKSITALRNKETRAKATAEAMKRLGQAEAPPGPGLPSSRGAFTMGPPTVGGVAPGGIAQGLARVGGGAGAAFGAVGSSLGSAVPAIAALGVAAVGVKIGLDALRASSELAAKTAGETVKLEQQRNQLIEAATKQLGQSTMAAAAEGGGNLRQFIARGGNLQAVQGIAERTGLNAGSASAVAAQVAGLDEGSRKVIEQAVADAVRLGVDPVKTAEALAASSKGGLGDMDRVAALRNAGNLFDNFRDADLVSATSAAAPGQASDPELDALQRLFGFSGRESRAAFGNLTSPTAINAADTTSAEAAGRVANPIQTALSEHAKILQKEVEVLEAMAKGEHPLIRSLNDLTGALKGGGGSYASQAARQRGIATAAGF